MIEPLAKVPRAKTRDTNDREADRNWRDVCRKVERRDGHLCRCCRCALTKTIRLQGDRMEHHHVIPKSRGGADTIENVAVICKNCHDERHVTRVLHITGNAEYELEFEKGGKTWRG